MNTRLPDQTRQVLENAAGIGRMALECGVDMRDCIPELPASVPVRAAVDVVGVVLANLPEIVQRLAEVLRLDFSVTVNVEGETTVDGEIDNTDSGAANP